MRRTRHRDDRGPLHAEWLEQHTECWWCGYDGWSPMIWLETHEIVRGVHRSKALCEPCTWVRTCNTCHRQAFDSMSVVRQLALKKLHDRDNYDRERVNVLRCRQPDAITEDEVDAEMENL